MGATRYSMVLASAEDPSSSPQGQPPPSQALAFISGINVSSHLYVALISVLMPVMIAIAYDPYSLHLAWSVPPHFKGAKLTEGHLPHWLCTFEAFIHWWNNTLATVINAELRTAMTTIITQVRWLPHKPQPWWPCLAMISAMTAHASP